MATLLSVILVILGIFNIAVGMLSLADAGRQLKVNRLFFFVCVSSMIWCMGYAFMAVAPEENTAYMLRAAALFGVFACCALIVRYTQLMSGIYFKYQKVFDAFLLCGGIVSYILVAMPRAVTFTYTSYGRYYYSNQWIGRYFQYVYLTVLFTACFRIGRIWRKNAVYRREKMMARYLLISSIVITLGAFFDAVFPMFGQPAFPSSAITTFFYIQIVYRSLKQYNATVLATAQVSRLIFKTIATPVIILDESLRIIDCNDNACEYIGGRREELVGSMYHYWMRYVQDNEERRIHTELLNLAGEITTKSVVRTTGDACSVVASPIYDKYGEALCLICLLNDNTKYESIREEADECSRRAALSEATQKAFIKRVNDRLLAPIEENLDFLEELKKSGSFADKDKSIDELIASNIHLRETFNELAAISKIDSGSFELQQHKYDLENLLLEVISESCELVDESKVRIITRISPTVPKTLTGDRKCLKHVLGVLLHNAVRYTREGRIMLQLSSEVEYGSVRLMFKIADTGIGIRRDDMDLIFGMEENGDTMSDGTGLSLAVCKRMVRMMGGSISVRSAWGRGSTFSFEVIQSTDNELGIVPYGNYKQSVLVIMDDQYKSEAIAHTVMELGIHCETMIRDQIDNTNLTADDDVTLVLVSAGIMGRMRAYLTKAYRYARFVPVYSYKNYYRLKKGDEGICGSLIFSHIKGVLAESER